VDEVSWRSRHEEKVDGVPATRHENWLGSIRGLAPTIPLRFCIATLGRARTALKLVK
jgi:hypothetical protein